MANSTPIAGLSGKEILQNSSNNLRDASFSSYLNSNEENLVCKLAESGRKIIVQEERHNFRRQKEDDGEIGVFSAEKYFNGVMDDDSPRITITVERNMKPDQTGAAVPVKPPKVHPGTPSIRSESSWNSQSLLLKSVTKNPSRRKGDKKRFLAGLLCNCCDKDSVYVKGNAGETRFNRTLHPSVVEGREEMKEHFKAGLDLENRSSSGSWFKEDIQCKNSEKFGIGMKKENCFTSLTSNSDAGNLPVRVQLGQEAEELILRKSLEVFGSPVQEKRNDFMSLEKKLTMLSWDAVPRVEEIEFSAQSGAVVNDNESDASSDLFEIESLTGKAVNPILARQRSEATSGCATPTTCYAPSEASIEWSVVTASVADFSVASDYEELRPSTTTAGSPGKMLPAASDARTRTSKELPRRGPSILLGCKSHKAVNVAAEQAYKASEKVSFDPRMRRSSESYIPAVTRFQAETKLMGLDPTPRQHKLTIRSFPRAHSPPGSHLLYIQ